MLFSSLFLGEVPKTGPKSTLHEKLKEDDALDSFRSLSEKYLNFRSGQCGIGSEIDTEPESEEDFTFTPFKKQRMM